MGRLTQTAVAVTAVLLFGGCKATTSSSPDLGPNSDAGGGADGSTEGLCNVLGDVCPQGLVCGRSGNCLEPGKCQSHVDCDPGRICDPASSTCVPGSACGGEKLVADVVPPNVMLSLDRSCSMNNEVTPGVTKWQIAVAALQTLTANLAGRIRFGLALFPDTTGNNCAQDSAIIGVDPGTELAIQTLLGAALQSTDVNYPDGPCVTNLDGAMDQLRNEPGLKDPARPNFAVLITDGKQAGCSTYGGAAGATQIAGELHTTRGLDTFVVGFGAGVNATELNALAVAGGRPTANATKQYYDASDQASLDAALSTITGQTMGCIYRLAQPPSDFGLVFVFFDGLEIGRDPVNGWDATGDTVTFLGAACDKLRSDSVKTVDIVFGCEAPPLN